MTEEPIQRVIRRMKERGVSPGIIERVARLNPRLEFGGRPRGYYPHYMRDPRPTMDAVGKRAFIAVHGTKAWESLPRFALIKSGKRKYCTRESYEDCLWLLPVDHPVRRCVA